MKLDNLRSIDAIINVGERVHSFLTVERNKIKPRTQFLSNNRTKSTFKAKNLTILFASQPTVFFWLLQLRSVHLHSGVIFLFLAKIYCSYYRLTEADKKKDLAESSKK